MRPSISSGNPSLSKRQRLTRWLAALSGLAVVGVVIGSVPLTSVTGVNLPPVQLGGDPMNLRGVAAKPTLTLALSVEYPTVGAAYVKQGSPSLDDTFDATKTYLGYFDYRGCYSYDATKQYFTRVKDATATNHTCGGDSYSGNFMNWASASAIDILRMGLTGGDRYIDDGQTTVLQRAVLPGDSHTDYTEPFYNSVYFPAKQLPARSSVLSGVLPTSVLNGYTGSVYIANCSNKIFIGKVSEGSCTSPGRNANIQTLFARVAVCGDANEAASRDTYRPGYCTRYPNGQYKPTGNLQQYSDKMRVAVFGYLLSNSPSRYGGVLRAPMSYLGQKDFDADYMQLATANQFAEWDANTGVFVKDARKSGFEYSGAINYINRFGRSGIYERYDAVSELYYESLRYLQGLPPTPDAAAGVSAAQSADPLDLKDGFPVYNLNTNPASPQQGWTDPHPASTKLKSYACVKNNIVTIGDVHTHFDKYVPGNRRSDNYDSARGFSNAANEPDFAYWTSVVGAFEAGSSLSYIDGAGRSQSTATPANPVDSRLSLANIASINAPLGSGDNNSYYMAGMAYWAHTHDIRPTSGWTDGATKGRPGMRVTTYTIDVNERADQTDRDVHRNNQYFLAAKYGGFDDYSSATSNGTTVSGDQGNPFVTKAADASTNPDPNDSWQRSTPQKSLEARNYFLGNEAATMLASIDKIFQDVARNAGSVVGNLAVDSRRVAETQSIYQGRVDPMNWTGDVISYKISDASSSTGFDISKANWSAADQLDKRTAPRNIVVGVQTGSATSALNFTWADLSGNPDYVKAFEKSPDDPTGQTFDSTSVAQDRVNYLRGDRSKESAVSGFRPRPAVKGLLGDIINSSVVFMGSPTRSISDLSYSGFLAAHQNRKVVFVGANDGMLHAFDAANGNELFAYIPSWLVPKLNALTSNKYTHESYVDATPTVSEAFIGGSTNDWRTVLVGGTGAGGQGVYALDVTDPAASFTTSNVMWEFTDADDADLGNVVGRPRILKLKVGGKDKWFAVIGSGVNNYVDDGHASTTGNPAIFLLDLSKKPSDPWSLNHNYYKVVLPKNGSATIATGVLNISAVTDSDRAATTLYAGDLHGQLWKIDVSSAAQLSQLDPQLVFEAKHNGTPQPISSAPALFRIEGNIVAVVGTGKMLEASDREPVNGAFPVQSVYAVFDGSVSNHRSLTSADLKKIDVTDTNWQGADFNWGIPSSDPQAPQVYAGWYFDFPSVTSTGERQVGMMLALPDTVVFNTIMSTSDGCASGGSSSASYTLSLFTGGGSRIVIDRVLADPLALEGATATGSAANNRSVDGTKEIDIKDCTADSCKDRSVKISRRLNRISWHDLVNFEEIRNRKANQ